MIAKVDSNCRLQLMPLSTRLRSGLFCFMNKFKVTTKVSSQGQITLKKNLMEALNLTPGAIVQIEVDQGKGVISKPKNNLSKYAGILKGKVDLTTEEFIKIKKQEANL